MRTGGRARASDASPDQAHRQAKPTLLRLACRRRRSAARRRLRWPSAAKTRLRWRSAVRRRRRSASRRRPRRTRAWPRCAQAAAACWGASARASAGWPAAPSPRTCALRRSVLAAGRRSQHSGVVSLCLQQGRVLGTVTGDTLVDTTHNKYGSAAGACGLHACKHPTTPSAPVTGARARAHLRSRGDPAHCANFTGRTALRRREGLRRRTQAGAPAACWARSRSGWRPRWARRAASLMLSPMPLPASTRPRVGPRPAARPGLRAVPRDCSQSVCLRRRDTSHDCQPPA